MSAAAAEAILAALGQKILPVKGDGNCLFVHCDSGGRGKQGSRTRYVGTIRYTQSSISRSINYTMDTNHWMQAAPS